MATVNVTKAHTLGLDEAKTRAHRLMERIQQKFSRMIGDVSWSEDGTEGVATGKIFSARFCVSEEEVSLTVELQGLGGKMLAPKIEKDLRKTIERKFSQ
jgi:hypothetical protein